MISPKEDHKIDVIINDPLFGVGVSDLQHYFLNLDRSTTDISLFIYRILDLHLNNINIKTGFWGI